jgi:hypothetical protein
VERFSCGFESQKRVETVVGRISSIKQCGAFIRALPCPQLQPKTGGHRATLLLSTGITLVAIALGAPTLAVAACPNETLRETQLAGVNLPDCRAYEQVTPLSKNGTNPTGALNEVQASPDGEQIIYLVPANMPGSQGSSNFPSFVSTRADGAWSSRGVLPPSPPGGSIDLILGWSEDLSRIVLKAVLPGASGAGVYVYETADESYQPLAGPLPETFFFRVTLAGVNTSDQSHIVFETRKQLLPEAVSGSNNIYEWHDGQLALVDVLPSAEGGAIPEEGAFTGPYAWENGNPESGGANAEYYTQSAISSDGNRVFFTASVSGQLYLREDGTTTVRVSKSQRAVPDPNGPRPAAFMSATPDGSEAFFTSCEQLTEDSTAVSTSEPSCTETTEGQDLYAFNVASEKLTDLTVDREAGDTLGAAVQGVVGTGLGSDGAPVVYFVANGVLAPGAQPGNCHGTNFNEETPLHCNLYVLHDGAIKFVAPMASGTNALQPADADNWYGRPELEAAPGREKTSRVSISGETLLFTSIEKLTSYENAGIAELYRYSLGSERIICVSCNPSGASPVVAPTLESIGTTSSPLPAASILRRNLSSDGGRVFFETTESLIPADGNGVQDVYEWEASEEGGCTSAAAAFSAQADGCIYLISSGSSPQPSFFADASSDGSDVFFFGSQSLVRQDEDALVDVYDAREGGGIPSQNETLPRPCQGEGCRSAVTGPLASASPTSNQLAGEGNLVASASPPLTVRKSSTRTAAQAVAEKLRQALKVCRRNSKKAKRVKCEKRARAQSLPASRSKKAGNRRRGK